MPAPKYPYSMELFEKDNPELIKYHGLYLPKKVLLNASRIFFEANIEMIPECGCWIWMGGVRDRYGKCKLLGKSISAHHASWNIYCGDIPKGYWILHRCDTPLCVNPNHLFIGTPRENTVDAYRKNRRISPFQEGENHCLAKLKEEDVIAIRSDSRLQKEIAFDYGVNKTTISEIKTRKTWKHI